MTTFHLNTPVALVIFNRPDTTELVFAEIAKAKPPVLLVIGDGFRPDRPGEKEQVEETREIVKRVNWDCKVLTNISDVNLGCGRRPASGFDWVFEQVDEAIILEDDCIPHPSFFRFCQEMLIRYRDDKRIAVISGDNFQFGYRNSEDSYYFSRYVYPWGWATWKDRWQDSYDYSIAKWPLARDAGILSGIFSSPGEVAHWTHIFDLVYKGKLRSCWDYQWMLACWLQNRISVIPNVNLISNIGFDPNATHTVRDSELANIPTEQIRFPLRHPQWTVANSALDSRDFKRRWLTSPSKMFLERMIWKLLGDQKASGLLDMGRKLRGLPPYWTKP
jgi:hypothetical protein